MSELASHVSYIDSHTYSNCKMPSSSIHPPIRMYKMAMYPYFIGPAVW